MKNVAVALILTTLFVLGRADTLRMSLGSREALETVMNGALAAGTTGRHLTGKDDQADLGSGILSDVAGAATTSPATIFSSFVKNIVSQAQDFSSFDQSQLGDFKLGALGALDVSDPIVAALSKLATDKPKSVLSAEQTIQDIMDEFCDPATCTSSSDPSASASSCTGKSATLALEPWSCTLDENATALECTPAVLVLEKTPAKCSLSASDLFSAKKMSHSGLPSGGNGDPMTYTGKSCQVTKSFGQATTDIYGADPFSLNLGALLGKGISDLSGSGSAAVQLAGDVVGNATAIGGK